MLWRKFMHITKFTDFIIPMTTRELFTKNMQFFEYRTNNQEILYDSTIKSPILKDYTSLIKNYETEQKIKQILMEHEFSRLTEIEVPKQIKIDDMSELLDCKTFSQRKELFYDIFLQECAVRHSIKEECQKNGLKLINSPEGHICYSFDHNSLHAFIINQMLSIFYRNRLVQPAILGQPFVFDFGYDEYMDRRSCSATAVAVQNAYDENLKHLDPFDIHFCNVKNSNSTYSMVKELMKNISSQYGNTLMITVSENSYLNVFSDKECIYLSPHAAETMESYDHHAVYIIGAFLDINGSFKPTTLARAKQDGIRCLQIPIEKYSSENQNVFRNDFSKVMKILLEFKSSGDLGKSISLVLNSRDLRIPIAKDNDGHIVSERKKSLKQPEKIKRFKTLLKDFW